MKVTRLHVRYTKETFPDDLMLQQTGDTKNFQGRYVLRHAFEGESKICEKEGRKGLMATYKSGLPPRFEKEAQTLASLTGWKISEIYNFGTPCVGIGGFVRRPLTAGLLSWIGPSEN